MRSLMLPALLGCLVAAACNSSAAQQDRRPSPGYIVGEPIQHKNLTIFPVLSKTDQNIDRYITLDEGLRAGTVEVIEVGASRDRPQAAPVQQAGAGQRPSRNSDRQSAVVQNPQLRPIASFDPLEASPRRIENSRANEVNRLMVVNRSGKPLYLMPGEVIVGGSQDRTIGEETTIAATGKPVSIDVFCVEHGRWGGRDVAESASLCEALDATKAVDAQALAEEARKGKFVATPGPLSKAGRVAVQSGKGQQEVWDNVQKINAGLRVDSDSGAFTQAYAAKAVRDELSPFVAALSAKVAAQGRVVGAVVAINGKIESVDVFESTPLFRKLWPKLLKSYALDAISATSSKSPANAKTSSKDKQVAKTASGADASAFLTKVLQGAVSDTKETPGGLVVTHRETKDAASYSAGGMGGGMGGPVHAAGYAR